jgi:hypothetical protein
LPDWQADLIVVDHRHDTRSGFKTMVGVPSPLSLARTIAIKAEANGNPQAAENGPTDNTLQKPARSLGHG